ncbi:MAG: hypothetical protein RI894_1125 [Bacteroidota bacterium]
MPITAISRSQNSATLRINEAERVIQLTCEKLNLEITPLHDSYSVKSQVSHLAEADQTKNQKANWLHYFAGLYVGYLVHVREQRVSTLFFLRIPNGNLKIRMDTSDGRIIDHTLTGRWSVINQNRTIADEIDALPDGDGYRVHQYLEATFQPDDTLVGTYSGFSLRDMKPIGGAVLLKKINDWVANEEQMLFLLGEQSAKDRSLSSHEDTTRLLRLEPQLLDFFMGNNDYNLRIENSQLFRNVGLLPLAPANTPSVSGCYYSYRLSIERTTIYANPFVIHADGRVHMKRSDSTGYYEEYRGFASFENGFLSVHIDRKLDSGSSKVKPIQLYFIYNWGNFNLEELDYAFGTGTMMTMFNKPRGGEEVLVPIKNGELKHLSPRKISIAEATDLRPFEAQIVDYLKNSQLCLADKMPNSL